MNIFLSAKNLVLDLLFPLFCFGCGKEEGVFFCRRCSAELHYIPPACVVCRKLVPAKKYTPPGRTCKSCRRNTGLYVFLSPFSYGDEKIRTLIHVYKYNRVREISSVLGRFLQEYIFRLGIKFPDDALIIPVPLHSRRERVRGFNQSLLMANYLGEKLGLQVRPGVLLKIKNTEPQATLEAEERRYNVAGVFKVAGAECIKNKTVILVDDVKTTGATLEEAARMLKEAGVKRIWAITVAH
jgi:ComF family protein